MPQRQNLVLRPNVRRHFGIEVTDVCRAVLSSGTDVPACAKYEGARVAAYYMSTADDVTCVYCLENRPRQSDWLNDPSVRQVRAYRVDVTQERQLIFMPFGARILSVAGDSHSQEVNVWAQCDPAAPPKGRYFAYIETGDPIVKAGSLTYIGSFRRGMGPVFHMYEVNDPAA